MKKYPILLFILTGFFLARCTQDDVPRQHQQAVEIRFRTTAYRMNTKAILTDDRLPAGASIGLFGWGHKTGETSPLTLRSDLNNNRYTTNDGIDFQSSAPAYFPLAEDTVIDFYAYYPYTAQAVNNRVPFSLNDQHDILYATPVLNKGKLDVQEDAKGNYTPISLQLNHALSAITIVIKKEKSVTDVLTLQKIELPAYPTSASLDITNGQIRPGNTTADQMLSDRSLTLTAEEQTVVKDYLVWPGEAPVFRFTISNHVYEVKPAQAFIPNRQQTYTFTIQTNKIGVSASLRPWIEGPTGSGEIIL